MRRVTMSVGDVVEHLAAPALPYHPHHLEHDDSMFELKRAPGE
jgi:hypothetical protein